MEKDFSVRNEVDSIAPPYADATQYNEEACSYDSIVEGIRNAPPFPSQPLDPSSYNPYAHPLERLVSQQANLIKQQQIANQKLIDHITKNNTSGIDWKSIALILGGAVLLLIWTRPRVIERTIPIARSMF